MDLNGMTEEQLMGLAARLPGVDLRDLPPAPPAHVSAAPDAMAKAAPPLPMSLSSKVGLGLLAATALPAVGYGIYHGYQHLTRPHEGEEGAAADELPKAASLRVSPQDIVGASTQRAPTARESAWSQFGF